MKHIPIILCCFVVVMTSCTKQSVKSRPAESVASASNKQLIFLTREGCVNTALMRANLDEALRAVGRPLTYQVIDLATLADSDPRGGYPTPTVLYENSDLFGMPEPPIPHPPAT